MTASKQILVERSARAFVAKLKELDPRIDAFDDIEAEDKQTLLVAVESALIASHAEEMLELLQRIASYPDANVISDAHYVVRKRARALLAKIEGQPQGEN